MKKNYLLSVMLCFAISNIFAQERYVDTVFTDSEIMIMADVEYAQNYDIFASIVDPNVTDPILIPLACDIYMPNPAIDDVENRPVIFVPAEDNFPRFVNHCWGAKDDLATTERCMRLAKMGYVAVAMNTRSGLNALAGSSFGFLRELARLTLRGALDAKAAARFMRKEVAENSNPYGVDPDKFVLWGQHLAGYTYAQHFDSVEDYNTAGYIVINPDTGQPENVFVEQYFGDVHGEVAGTDPDSGVPTNFPNHPGYSSEFQLLVGNGYVSVDTNYIQANDTPIITFSNGNYFSSFTESFSLPLPSDPTEICCEVFHASVLAIKANEVGINSDWEGVEFVNPIANDRSVYQVDPSHGTIEGFKYIYGDPNSQIPWTYWDVPTCEFVASTDPALANTPQNSLDQNPTMTVEQGRLMQDTMLQFFAPRACITLGLPCAESVTSTRNTVLTERNISVFPNPSKGNFTFASSLEFPMESIQIFNVAGALMYETKVENSQITLENIELSRGMYFAKIQFEDGIATKKLIVEK